MIKKVLFVVAAVIVIAVILEAIALVHERNSLTSFATYWKQQNATAAGDFTYVALGDSTAQGIGAGKPTDSYTGILAERIAKQTGKKVRFINLSVSGAKVRDVIDKQIPQIAQYKPDLVTIEAGANDIPRFDEKQFARDFTELAGLLPARTYVSDIPYFGGRISKNREALAASASIYTSVTPHNLRLVRLQNVTRDRDSFRDYAVDLFHPSSRGYQNWADAFWVEIQPELTLPSNPEKPKSPTLHS